MSGQENLEIEPEKIIHDIFGNEVAFGIAQQLDETSIYIWPSNQPLPIMFNLKDIDSVIDELIDKKLDGFKAKEIYINKEEMYISECCNKIVYGAPSLESCIYCE